MLRPGGQGLVGLDIGTSAVRAAEVTVGGDYATLHKFAQVELPDGAVRNGEIADRAAVTSALKQLWQKGRFSSRKVAIGVANQRVVVRQVDLPWVPQKELRKSLGFHVGDLIPMPVDEAVLDFDAAEEITADDGRRMLRVLLVAANKDMVRAAIDAVSAAGLHPASVDLIPFAIMRSLGGGGSATGLETDGEALVDIGADVTNIVVHQNGAPRFVRMLVLGGRDITDALAERLGVEHDVAETTKVGMALPVDAGNGDSHPAGRALEAAASEWIEELRQSLDYYGSQPDSIGIRRLVLSGGGAQLEGLAQRIATTTRKPVVLASPLSGMRFGKAGQPDAGTEAYAARMAVPVGLALGKAS